jgi:hypothetical protein
MSDNDEGRSSNKRRARESSPPSYKRPPFYGGVHPAERKRRHNLRAYFLTLHEIRVEVQRFNAFLRDTENELRTEFNDISSKFVVDKCKMFTSRMARFGHCPLSGDAINDMTYINACGHVFNTISLEKIEPKLKKCPICRTQIGYPYQRIDGPSDE